MIVPAECIKWINLQRTGYKNPINQFKDQIQKEYLEMREYLPTGVESILDIGCGLAGIDILLSKHYGQPELFLMDNSEIDKNIYYGFKEKGACYNSFEETEKLMKVNYIKNYNLIDIKEQRLPVFKKMDLVISLLSCGYHYPINEYLDYINTILSKNGALILDIREWSDGIEIIKEVLPNITEISHYNKSIRIIARRK